jgi:lipopolysaccharide/colanic/teichoic acid biosynthesis glycosyltransferase
LFEAVAAGAGLIICAPVLLLPAAAVALTSRGPVFFRQERVGRHGGRFCLLKLRTMYVSQGGIQVTARDDRRITPVGRVLRKTKLDELPGLWNVVKGDMSLVGPRPEVPRYVDLRDRGWQRVLEARPGITDPVTARLRNEEELLAEVGGDREEFYLKRLVPYKLDGYLEYLGRRSPRSDLAVIWRTLCAVVLPGRARPVTLNEVLRHGGEAD